MDQIDMKLSDSLSTGLNFDYFLSLNFAYSSRILTDPVLLRQDQVPDGNILSPFSRSCIESDFYIKMYKQCGDTFDAMRKYIPRKIKQQYKKNNSIIDTFNCLFNFSSKVGRLEFRWDQTLLPLGRQNQYFLVPGTRNQRRNGFKSQRQRGKIWMMLRIKW